MAIVNGYATVEELQRHIDASGGVSWVAADIELLELAIEAASRWIDEMTGSRFYAVEETRFYAAEWHDLIYIDDATAVTSIRTDDDGDGVFETEWLASDYRLEPIGAANLGLPYRQIRITDRGRYVFPRSGWAGVQVTGSFGYGASAPAPVRMACLLVAHRLWSRKDAIFGVAGTPGLGVTIVQARINADADVMALLDAVERRYV